MNRVNLLLAASHVIDASPSELVFTHVREYFIVIDRDFIYEIGVLYLTIAAQAMIASLKNRFQEE